MSGGTISKNTVATPNLDDHQFKPEEFETVGKFSPIASMVVLTVLYLAGVNRPNIVWTVNTLAREVTRWTIACDKRLLRLISYIHFRKNLVGTSSAKNFSVTKLVEIFRLVCSKAHTEEFWSWMAPT